MVEEPVHVDWLETPVGTLLLGSTDRSVCLLEFTDAEEPESPLKAINRRFARGISPGTSPVLAVLKDQLNEYFAGTRQRFDLPLHYSGTPFQKLVWDRLLEIPYGQTWSYGQLAERIGDRDAARAVGAANGMNPIAIVVPCHRVINANGTPGGFGGGTRRKQILLDLERGQLQLRL